MTVAELIEELQKYDPGTIAILDCYGSGLVDLQSIKQVKVVLYEGGGGERRLTYEWDEKDRTQSVPAALLLPDPSKDNDW